MHKLGNQLIACASSRQWSFTFCGRPGPSQNVLNRSDRHGTYKLVRHIRSGRLWNESIDTAGVEQCGVLTMEVLKGTRAQFQMLLRDEMIESGADDVLLHAGFNRLQCLMRAAPYHS